MILEVLQKARIYNGVIVATVDTPNTSFTLKTNGLTLMWNGNDTTGGVIDLSFGTYDINDEIARQLIVGDPKTFKEFER